MMPKGIQWDRLHDHFFSEHLFAVTTDTASPSNSDTDDRQPGSIQVIARVNRIMRALSAHPQPCGMSLAAIAHEVGLPRSTVQRIIAALVLEHIVEPAGPTGFRIGPALGQMLYQTHSDIVPVLKPHIEQLSLKLQETVCVARMQMQKLHFVDAVVGEQILRIVPPVGITSVMQITAASKVLLARMDDTAVKDWITQNVPDLNPTALKAQLRDIQKVRQQGYATDGDNIVPGISALAIAIGTYRGPYAIVVLAPTVRMQPGFSQFLEALLVLRGSLENLLGTPVAQ